MIVKNVKWKVCYRKPFSPINDNMALSFPKKTADSGDVWKQTCILPFLCSIVSDIDAKVVWWWQVYLVIACNTGKLALQ